MRNFWLFRDIPPLALWFLSIGGVLSIGGTLLLNGWYVYLTQGAAFTLWGIALIMTAMMQQRCEHQSALYRQPRLWFGLLFLVMLPDGAVLLLQESHVLPEGLVEEAIILGSVAGCLFCLALGVYFWWRKRRMMARPLCRAIEREAQ